jgi:hypothetical protein
VNPLRHRVLTSSATLILGLLACLSATAAPMLDSLPEFRVLSSRLELTPEQESKLAPLFDKRVAELRAAREKLEQAGSRQDQRDVLRSTKQAGDEFSRQVESVLTPSQQHKWRDLRKEMREQAKERIEDAHGSRKP